MPNQPAPKRMLALCCLALVSTGYALTWVTSPIVKLSEQQRIDNTIAEIVLTDLATHNHEWMGFSLSGSAPRTIYFIANPPDHVGDVLESLSSDRTGQIDDPREAEIRQAVKQLEARHTAGAGLISYYPRNRLLRRVEYVQPVTARVYSSWYIKFDRWYFDFSMSEFGRPIDAWVSWLTEPFIDDYQADFPIELTAPGYSKDGRLAVLWMYCPELMHPTFVTYVLERSGNTWRILRVEFTTYL